MSDESDILSATVTRLFTDHCAPEVVEAADGDWDPILWDRVEAAGLSGVGLPQELGGSGGTTAEAAAVVRIAARFAAPIPLAETVLLSGWLRSQVGLATSSRPSTVVWGPDPESFVIHGSSKRGWTLRGKAERIPWARVTDSLTVLARLPAGEYAVALVPTHDAIIDPGSNLAGEPRDQICFEDLDVPPESVRVTSGVSPETVQLRGAFVSVILMAGALERTLALTCQYAKDRQQFGRSISSFQAIKHQIALLAGEVAVTVTAAQAATASVEGDRAGIEVAAAKLRAARAATLAAEIAHQVHGAIGFTREHQLQHFTRRLWSWRDEFGTEGDWEERLGRRIASSGAGNLWELVVAGGREPARERS